ncbi:MAG: methyl-accepting chemotaxis protein [Candidatus Bathyarchaeia archaeon]
MHTSSKILAIAIVAVLVLSVLAPFSVVMASTGHPKLGAVDDRTNPTAIQLADYNVSIPAGTDVVELVDGSSPTGDYFAIVFYDTSPLVTFSGAQFDLYISKDGYSQISADDKCYASAFYVSDLESSPLKKVTKTNALLKGGKADFYIGKFSTYKVLVGPVPFDITADYKFIKIYDGVVTSVAVSAQTIVILPSLELTPTSGPAGRTVTLKGTALQSNKLLNLTYGATPNTNVIAQVTTDEYGKFTYSWAIKDLKAEFTGTNIAIPYDPVDIYVWYNATGALVDQLTYNEYERAFVQLKSVKYGDVAQPFSNLYTGSGNDTLTVDVYVADKLVVAGSWWNPTSDISFTVGTISLGTAAANATGFFNITLTIPELASGSHTVKVSNAGVLYVFTIVVYPTLILEPEKGPIGTVVSCFAYGFPANQKIYIWWYDYEWSNIVNGTTGSNGKFNVTVQFTVHHTYGGIHHVAATDVPTDPSVVTPIAEATFEVTPLLSVIPSVIKNDCSKVTAVGTGFDPSIGYHVNIDNNALYCGEYGYIWPNDNGDLNVTFIAAGFRPGLHVISLYKYTWVGGAYEPAIYACFTVTAEGDYIGDLLLDINSTVVDVKNGMATISTALGTITTSLTSLGAKIDKVDGTLATISTNIGTITTTLNNIGAKVTEISGTTATIKTDLGTLTGKVTSVSGDVATIKTDLGTVKMDVSDVKNTVPGISIPIWIAVILSLIAAIASIYAVITIRRKIAG